jgi:hypothetical protein
MEIDVVNVSISIGLAIIGIVAGYYLSRRSKEPCWAIRSNNIIEGYSDKYDNLKILFKNESIKNLTISKVLFWNNGVETIDRPDIETANKLRIECISDAEILDVKILVSNHSSNQFEVIVSDDKKCAYIQFDYLDQQQGAVIQIIHTGIGSNDLHLTGDIKGAKISRKRLSKTTSQPWANPPKKPETASPKVMLVALTLVGAILVFAGIVKAWFPSLYSTLSAYRTFATSESDYSVPPFFFIILGIIFLFFGLSKIKEITPKGLEAYDSE